MNAIAHREFMRDFPIDAHTGQAARIILYSVTGGSLNSKHVGAGVDANDSSIFASFESGDFTAPRIADNVVDLIQTGQERSAPVMSWRCTSTRKL